MRRVNSNSENRAGQPNQQTRAPPPPRSRVRAPQPSQAQQQRQRQRRPSHGSMIVWAVMLVIYVVVMGGVLYHIRGSGVSKRAAATAPSPDLSSPATPPSHDYPDNTERSDTHSVHSSTAEKSTTSERKNYNNNNNNNPQEAIGGDGATHTAATTGTLPHAQLLHAMFPARAATKRVVIVGGGLAGQSAAIEAIRHGAEHVVLLEKEKRLGGNSAKATSGINGWGTRAQRAQKVDDGPAYFERDTYRSGAGGQTSPGLVRMLSARSAAAIEFLESFGVPLSVLSQLGGASRKRCHRAPDKPDGTPLPIGFTIVSTLEKYLRGTAAASAADGGAPNECAGKVDIITGAALRRILYETVPLNSSSSSGAVTVVRGVEYEQLPGPDAAPEAATTTAAGSLVQLEADAVILATGGFSNDHTTDSLLAKHAPQLAAFPTTNGVWATGDGVKAASALGAALVDMDKVQLHPTGLLNPKDPRGKTVFLGPEALRGSGGILLNSQGRRFVDELQLRSVVSRAILEQRDEFPGSDGRRFAHCVLNDAAADAFGRGTLGFYWKKMGLFQMAEDVGALAALLHCDEATLRETLTQYERLSSAQTPCPQTNKTVYPAVLGPNDGPYYVAYVTPSIHYTMGGCLINPAAQILRGEESHGRAARGLLAAHTHTPIYGLFGAGEVTGGVHGGNRLGGNSLLECVVFGRIAGAGAARLSAAATTPQALAAGEGGGNDDNNSNQWVELTVLDVRPAPGAVANGGSDPSASAAVIVGDEGVAAAARQHGLEVTLGLPSALQTSGLSLLQPLLVRARGVAGQTRTAQLLPASHPSHLGSVTLHLPATAAAEGGTEWLYQLRPGQTVEAKKPHLKNTEKESQEAFRLSADTRELAVIASAPHGVPALLQLLADATTITAGRELRVVRVLYEGPSSAAMPYLANIQSLCAGSDGASAAAAGAGGAGAATAAGENNSPKFICQFVARDPVGAWTGEVGTIDESLLHTVFPGVSNTNDEKDRQSAAAAAERARAAALSVVVAGNATWTGPIASYLVEKGYGDSLTELKL